jgi:hypothetical protein
VIKAWIDVLIAIRDALAETFKALSRGFLALLKPLSSSAIEIILLSGATFLGAAAGLAALREYGFAVLACAIPSTIWLARALRWTGVGPKPPIIVACVRSGLAVLAISFTVAVYLGARSWRNQEGKADPWFPSARRVIAVLSRSGTNAAPRQIATGAQPDPTPPSPNFARSSSPATPLKANSDNPAGEEKNSPIKPEAKNESKPKQTASDTSNAQAEKSADPPKPPPFDPNSVVLNPVPGVLAADEKEKLSTAAKIGNDVLSCLNWGPQYCSNQYREKAFDLQTDLKRDGIGCAELDKSITPLESPEHATSDELVHLAKVLFEVSRKIREIPEPQAPPIKRTLTIISTPLNDPNFAFPDGLGISNEKLKSLSAQATEIYRLTTDCLIEYPTNTSNPYTNDYNLEKLGQCLATDNIPKKLTDLRDGLRNEYVVIKDLDSIGIVISKRDGMEENFRRLAQLTNTISAALATLAAKTP